ncbi:MAG: N-acetyl-gamma-glutamyl-phosphate reductase [Opitutales bacterium]
MNVGIAGASGYSGLELVRLLARHPKVTLTHVTSRSLGGQRVDAVMPMLRGLVPAELAFSDSDPQAMAQDAAVDWWFLALPHGVAADFARPLVDAGKRVIDLSADFRLGSPELYAAYYGKTHAEPELLRQAPYVIPEWHPLEDWKAAALIACPGCYPTSLLVPLLPLLKAGVLTGKGIVCNSLSGVSGAGKKVDEAYLFCERNESAKAYALTRHRHLSEIEEQLGAARQSPVVVQFNPHLAPMSRGIVSTITVPADGQNLDALYTTWNAAYADRPFVQVLPSGTFPDSAHVTGTNRIDLAAVHDARTGNYVITSAEDNLLKGASGQAVQIFNLACGFAETDGLL